MWKKFLAALAIVATFATSTAFAVTPGDPIPGGGNATNYVTGLSVSPATFDPSANEVATVRFSLSSAAQIFAYVTNEQHQLVGTLSNYAATPAGNVSLIWTGKSNGVALADGAYTVKVYTILNQTSIVDYDFTTVNISTTPVDEFAPQISGLRADPSTFSPITGEDTEISFSVNNGAYVSVVVKQGSEVVKHFDKYEEIDWYSPKSHSLSWDGTKDADVNGVTAILADGTYAVEVTVDDFIHPVDKESIPVVIATDESGSNGILSGVTFDPSRTWDPTEGELKIEGDLLRDASSFLIEAWRVQGNIVERIEIVEDTDRDDGDFEETWDGTDDDGDYIREGTWAIVVRAESSVVVRMLTVSYGEASIGDSFVTKESFDPSLDEVTNLVVKPADSGLLTVEVYKAETRLLTLVDEEEVRKNRWYAFEYDGLDREDDELTPDNDYKFKVTIENETENNVKSVEWIEFDVSDDEVSDKKVNVTNDYSEPIVFDDDEDDSMTIGYRLDDDAEVFIAVYEGTSTSGNAEIELLDYVEQSEGSHTVSWDGRDEDGRKLSNGIYTYKVVSKSGSNKDTETGKFVAGRAGEPTPTPGPTPTPTPTPTSCSRLYYDLDYLNTDNELCAAISWATEEGIVDGYPDGSFKPYSSINRAEVLKMIFEAFNNVTILPANGDTFFSDIMNPFAWYMPYVRTARVYGMLSGYSDGTARLSNNINRVELLKFVLEASNAFTGFEVPYYGYTYYRDVTEGAWYLKYADIAYEYKLFDDSYDVYTGSYYLTPDAMVQRGEVALLLYRMNKQGLLK